MSSRDEAGGEWTCAHLFPPWLRDTRRDRAHGQRAQVVVLGIDHLRDDGFGLERARGYQVPARVEERRAVNERGSRPRRELARALVDEIRAVEQEARDVIAARCTRGSIAESYGREKHAAATDAPARHPPQPPGAPAKPKPVAAECRISAGRSFARLVARVTLLRKEGKRLAAREHGSTVDSE